MIIYIAGPMTGRPGYNREAFAAAEQRLREKGHKVLNPGCLPADLPDRAYMPICLAMLQQAAGIYLLEGYQDSPGAMLELSFARRQGLKIMEE